MVFKVVEAEMYRLMSMKGTINKDDIEGIGINIRKGYNEPRVSVEFKDGTVLIGKDIKNVGSQEAFEALYYVTNEFFEIEEPTTSIQGG